MRPSARTPATIIFQLADLFRADVPDGWGPAGIRFACDLAPVRAAGSTWQLHVEACAEAREPPHAIVTIAEDAPRALRRGMRRRARWFEFLDAVEHTMHRRGYPGEMELGRHGRPTFGYFRRRLTTIQSVQRELDALASLRRALVPRAGRQP
jgi:hypothetical protein